MYCSIWAFMQPYMTSMIHMLGCVYGYVCVLRVDNIDWYTHAYYAISVYVCGECTCWLSPDIYSCIPILNMYIECRCPAYTCVYVMKLGWRFFSTLLFCKLLSLITYFHWSCIIWKKWRNVLSKFYFKKETFNYLKPFVIVFWIFTRRIIILKRKRKKRKQKNQKQADKPLFPASFRWKKWKHKFLSIYFPSGVPEEYRIAFCPIPLLSNYN